MHMGQAVRHGERERVQTMTPNLTTDPNNAGKTSNCWLMFIFNFASADNNFVDAFRQCLYIISLS